MDEKSAVYGLSQPAKALCSDVDSDRSRFWLATLGLTLDNQIHLIDYDEDSDELTSCSYRIDPEVLCLLHKNNHLLTCSQSKDNSSVQYWKPSTVESESIVTNHGTLELIRSFEYPAQWAIWDHFDDKKLVVFSKNEYCWLNNEFQVLFKGSITSELGIEKAALNPHSSFQMAVAVDHQIQGYDTRQTKLVFNVDQAHSHTIDVDYNPNKPHVIASGGEDGTVKLWDTRNLTRSTVIQHHSHWVNCIAFNHFHDQLLLSAGSDGIVCLESVISLSSASYEQEESQEYYPLVFNIRKPVDGLVHKYDHHEDSVYAIAWSAADPWIFASLSYDGRLVISKVPTEHKYKIIL